MLAARIALLASLALGTSGIQQTKGTLASQLNSLLITNQGVVTSQDSFKFGSIPCGYLEAENVTCSQCSWGIGGSCPYLFQYDGAVPQVCTKQPVNPGQDRSGGDYRTQELPQADYHLCENLCCAEEQCAAWTYVPSAPSVYLQCSLGSRCCYLKGSAPGPTNSSIPGIVSGSVTWPSQNLSSPPLGMRSAVPLGGLGAGAFELRADGTFHEWSIVNQHPAGAAKFGVVGDALLGYRVARADGSGSAVARTIRTTPPAGSAGIPGVDAIAYSGSYPVSRLEVRDSATAAIGLNATLFAYSALKPGDVVASGIPAVAFSLVVTNTGATAPLNVSFLLSLPLGAVNDCSRNNTAHTDLGPRSSAADCLAACNAAAQSVCVAWTFDATRGVCSGSSAVAHSVFVRGSWCGLRGSWRLNGATGAVTLASDPFSGSPASGDATILPLSSAGGRVSAAVAPSIGTVWSSFVGGAGVFPAAVAPGPVGTPATHGAVAVASAPVAPGATTTLSAVFSWYYPDRDHSGAILGNNYATRFNTAEEAAQALGGGGEDRLAEVVCDLNAHHAVFGGAGSILPLWLVDAAINEMSHFRGMIWTRDGRMREYEANDCPDVDSIHNDFQRHLPYLWMFPVFERQKLVRWGAGAASDGHTQEYLGSFDLGPFDEAGGRVMGDTTTLWITELFELYSQTGDIQLVTELYPMLQRAVAWQIAAAKELDLPSHLVCTYDILALEVFNTTMFNSMLHILAMRAGAALAAVMNDPATVAAANDAATRATAAVQRLHWNSTTSYYRAYTGGDAVMADSLYGAMIAHHLGFGWIVNVSSVLSHLAAEAKYNGNPYGLTVLTGRHTPPPLPAGAASSSATSEVRVQSTGRVAALRKHGDQQSATGRGARVDTQDDVVWLGGGPTWSYMHAAAGDLPLTDALSYARATTENFRTRLADNWNLVGITTSSSAGWGENVGMPYITSHYGFLLPNLYLVYAISGQMADLPHGQLSFDPVLPAPGSAFVVPLLLPGTTGTVAYSATSQEYTVSIAFGALVLPAGGLRVQASAYGAPIDLSAGDSLSWRAAAE